MRKISRDRFPTAGNQSGAVYMLFGLSTAGGPVSGATCVGLTSGATGTCVISYENPNRIAFANVMNGPGGTMGTPFLPNEVIEQVDTPSKTVTILPQPKITTRYGGWV